MGLYPRIERSVPVSRIPKAWHNVWFVDSGDGDDGQDGNRREKPLASIVAAIERCTHENQDTIFVTTRYHTGETYPIVVDKSAVHIIGLPPAYPSSMPGTMLWQAGGSGDTGALFTLCHDDQKLQNFSFQAGASYPCINFQAGYGTLRINIDSCQFETGTYGIYAGPAATQPSHHLAITRCMFGPGPTQLASGAIHLGTNSSWVVIADNFFDSTPGPLIFVVGSGLASYGGRILRNHMILPADDTVGDGITLKNPSSRYLVADNYCNDNSNGSMSFNPYLDELGESVWIKNYVGNGASPTDPA